MARPGIEYIDVEEAIETLVRAEKRVPTIRRLRDYLGQGSDTTLSKHLNTWKSEKALAALSDEPTLTPPSSSRMMKHLEQAWSEMTKANQEKMQKVLADKEKVIQLQANDIAQARAQYQELQETNALLQSKCDDYQVAQLRHETAFGELTAQHDTLRGQYGQAIEANTQLEATTKKILHRFEQQYEQTIASLRKKEEQLMVNNQDQMSQLMKQTETERHRQMVRIDELMVQRDKLKETLCQREQQITGLEQVNQQLKLNESTLQNALKQGDKQIENYRAIREDFAQRDKMILSQNNKISEQLGRSCHEFQAMTEKLDGLQARLNKSKKAEV